MAEVVASASLALVVVGSGYAAQTYSPGQIGLELLENALVTGAGLVVLIVVFAPLSGAHMNPVVSVVATVTGRLARRDPYLLAQCVGCVSGVLLANGLFSAPVVEVSHHVRATSAHLVGEVVATAGLITVVVLLADASRQLVAVCVGAYITGAYFYTSSTSFANPAITLGRVLTTSFAGIAPGSLAPFVLAQVLGAAVGLGLVTLLHPRQESS